MLGPFENHLGASGLTAGVGARLKEHWTVAAEAYSLGSAWPELPDEKG